MTHDELVIRAGKWLAARGCSLVLRELVTMQAEQPDAIGWRHNGRMSYLVECKATRGDFLKDKAKSFRRDPHKGMGAFRYFLCEPGLIMPHDLPPRWGLLYCHAKSISTEVGHRVGSIVLEGDPWYWPQHERNLPGEMVMMHSALSRLRVDMGDARFDGRIHLSYMNRQAEKAAA